MFVANKSCFQIAPPIFLASGLVHPKKLRSEAFPDYQLIGNDTRAKRAEEGIARNMKTGNKSLMLFFKE